jgi:adenosylcobinamide kinase/adenosylcobinamide-phosphate guanylyltransferase
MARTGSDNDVAARIEDLTSAIREFGGVSFIVSNEVGFGIVPDNPLARRFRDLAGFLNQRIAQTADEAYLMAAGIPVKIK